MKIGLVCPYNLFKGGGVQECVFALQKELSSRGHEALIITPQPKTINVPVPDYVRLLGRSRDFKSPFHTTTQISVSVDTDQVDELLENEKFDVLHFHEPWVPFLSLQLLTRSKAKNIATFHAKLPDTMMSRTIEKLITPYTKSILKYFSSYSAVSDAALSYVRTLTDNKISIIPNGIDLTKYNISAKNETNKDYIFYIGRLEKRKGLKYLLKAFKILQNTDHDIELVIAGDGPDRDSLEKYALENDIKAIFLGQISEKEKLQHLSNAKLFCTPARYGESFGIVLLEAMAMGLPIVAGKNPGYSSVLKGTGEISLVDPIDTHEFASRLNLMLTNDEFRKVWVSWANKEIKKYSYPLVVDKYEQIYKI